MLQLKDAKIKKLEDTLKGAGKDIARQEKELEKVDNNISDLKQSDRVLDDMQDDVKQQALIGAINVTFNQANTVGARLKHSLGLGEETEHYDQVDQEGIVKAISERYSVDFQLSDLSVCRRTGRKGNVLIRFKDLRDNRPFMRLVKAIKSPNSGGKDQVLYCNFPLTPRRQKLLYRLRQIHRENRVKKYYVDFTGDIQLMKHNLAKPVKTKLTSVVDWGNNSLYTYTLDELEYDFGSLEPQEGTRGTKGKVAADPKSPKARLQKDFVAPPPRNKRPANSPASNVPEAKKPTEDAEEEAEASVIIEDTPDPDPVARRQGTSPSQHRGSYFSGPIQT